MRAFLHEARTFLAEPEAREKLEDVRQLMEAELTGSEARNESKAA
jgi:hypothetical protein